MPANTPNFDPTADPYFNDESEDGLSAFERGEQQNRAQQTRETIIERLVSQHRSEVEDACRLRGERIRTEDQVQRFESDPAFRARVSTARKARGILAFSIGIVILIFFADLFLATPDLAEDLAHPVMSLMPESWLGESSAEATENQAATGGGTANLSSDSNEQEDVEQKSVPTPNWLRLVIGVVLSLVVLALTITVKLIGDETSLLRARRRLGAGDAHGWRTINQQLWTRRAIKLGYLVIMLGAFSWLYTYAEKRAEVMESLASESTDELSWDNLGVSLLSTGEVETDEAAPVPAVDSANADSKEGGNLALGAAATYVMLFILHALLLMLPMPQSTMDLPLAGFNPHRAGNRAAAMKLQEDGLLRGIVARIQTVRRDDDIRETLITLSEPVARAVNELYERDLMPLPAPVEVIEPVFTYDTTAEIYPDDEEPDTPTTDQPGHRQNQRTTFPEDDEDPGQIIFG
jgi:hypothetical protein